MLLFETKGVNALMLKKINLKIFLVKTGSQQ